MTTRTPIIFLWGRKLKLTLPTWTMFHGSGSWEKDAENLELLSLMIADITPEHDTKLQTLLDLIRKKIEHPINPVQSEDHHLHRFFRHGGLSLRECQQVCQREIRSGNG